ncbi:MAG: SLBB domain-containing protein [Ignavibacteriaceae bacterium]|nr:SLBB domain-containing protein [Ignavibacteriaceae bacterium]
MLNTIISMIVLLTSNFRKGIAFMLFLSCINTVVFTQTIPTYTDRSSIVFDANGQTASEDPSGDLSVDEETYVLGPGDGFSISIDNAEALVYEARVNPDGFLIIPKAGIVKVSGMILKDAKKNIIALIREKFKTHNILVTLSTIRSVKVDIFGEVQKRGGKVIFANSRLSDVLLEAGINKEADIRNIKVISKLNVTSYYDFLQYMRLADRSQNPVVQEGDHISIGKIDRSVSVTGAVGYAGIYEYKAGETVLDLIKIAGGFLDEAFTDTIEIIRFLPDAKTQIDIKLSNQELIKNNFNLQNKDIVVVRSKPEYLKENIVTITGQVKYPGKYKIDKDKTHLSELITISGGYLEKASLMDASLRRFIGADTVDAELERIKLIPRPDMTDDEYDYMKAKSRQRKGQVVVDFRNIFRSYEDDVVLRNGDEILIPEKKEYIIIIGQAVFPGNVEYMPGLTVQDYIKLAGGFSWRAEQGEVRIVKAKTGEWIEEDEILVLEPGDTIWIPEEPPAPKFWDIFKDSLTILGQVATVVAATIAVIVSSR